MNEIRTCTSLSLFGRQLVCAKRHQIRLVPQDMSRLDVLELFVARLLPERSSVSHGNGLRSGTARQFVNNNDFCALIGLSLSYYICLCSFAVLYQHACSVTDPSCNLANATKEEINILLLFDAELTDSLTRGAVRAWRASAIVLAKVFH